MDRVTADARSGIHSHVGSQALGEVHHRLVDVFLWQLFPDGLQGDFQLICRLRFRLEFMVLFQTRSPADSNLESLKPLILLNELGTVRLVLESG